MFRLLVIGIACVATIAAQQRAAGPYNAQQAASGRTLYQANCAICHVADLGGRNEAPQLAGSNFIGQWGDRTTGELVSFMQTTMPPNNPRGLGEEAYINLAAFILDANGARPGNQLLTADAQVQIRSIATGQVPDAIRQPAAQTSAAAQAPPGRGEVQAAQGVTLEGEVKNYRPLTDAMLLHPDPADWLMIRGNYQAWDYSALNQITRDNVGELRLQWVWSMSDAGGNNQTAPIVHNGVLYLNNPSSTLQALDARSGELIWENRYGGPANASSMRGIAIYEDKIYVHQRRAIDRLQRTQRQEGLGNRDRRSVEGQLQHQQRSHRDQGQGGAGPGRVRALSRREVLHQRL